MAETGEQVLGAGVPGLGEETLPKAPGAYGDFDAVSGTAMSPFHRWGS